MRILSIDGGGIRGIIPGIVIAALEKRLQDLANDANVRIADYFDLVAGTSTGGILTCLYLCPDSTRPAFSASDAVEFYLDRGDDIFDVALWQRIRSAGGLLDAKYTADGLDEALDDYLADCTLSQLLKPCLITAYDIRRRKAHFFKQHRAVVSRGNNFLLKDVARATSAAPTYFEVAKIKSLSRSRTQYPLIDGGVFANNPALCAYAEARTFKVLSHGQAAPEVCTAKTMFVLSLGTGKVEHSYTYKEAKDWGPLGWAKPVLDIMMSGVAETVDYQLAQIFASVGKSKQYVRIEPDLGNANPDLDDASGKNLAALKSAGDECVKENAQILGRVARDLVNWAYAVAPAASTRAPRETA